MPEAINIPDWVPAEAREDIEIMSDLDLPPETRAVLGRLATYEDMRGVWRRLSRGKAGGLIFVAVEAFVWANNALRKPIATRRLTMPASEMANCARRLAGELRKPNRFETEFFAELWSGDPPITFSQYIYLLQKTGDYFEQLHKEIMQTIRDRKRVLPRISRKFSLPNARQIYFARAMAKLLAGTYGRPLDAVNAALVTVIFNLKDPIGEETVRGWRRLTR
jgi:hypothetical protein